MDAQGRNYGTKGPCIRQLQPHTLACVFGNFARHNDMPSMRAEALCELVLVKTRTLHTGVTTTVDSKQVLRVWPTALIYVRL